MKQKTIYYAPGIHSVFPFPSDKFYYFSFCITLPFQYNLTIELTSKSPFSTDLLKTSFRSALSI